MDSSSKKRPAQETEYILLHLAFAVESRKNTAVWNRI